MVSILNMDTKSALIEQDKHAAGIENTQQPHVFHLGISLNFPRHDRDLERRCALGALGHAQGFTAAGGWTCHGKSENPHLGQLKIPHPPLTEVADATGSGRCGVGVKVSSPVVGEEDGVVGQERWEELKRLKAGGMTVSGISRATGLDRKTVRRCLRQVRWQAYRGAPRRESLPMTLCLYLIECP